MEKDNWKPGLERVDWKPIDKDNVEWFFLSWADMFLTAFTIALVVITLRCNSDIAGWVLGFLLGYQWFGRKDSRL